MSQHHCESTHQGRPVHVVMGWDRPLQYVFLTVELEGAIDEDDEPIYVYHNFNEPPDQPLTLEHAVAVLKRLDIAVPQSMISETAKDRDANVGNREVFHPL